MLDFVDALVPRREFAVAGESYGAYIARGIVHERPRSVGGVLLICPVIIAEHSKRNVPAHRVFVKEAGLRTPRAEKGATFKSIAVVQTAKLWRRFKEELLPGMMSGNQEFLIRLQGEAYSFSFDVDDLPSAFEGPSLILTGRQDFMVGYQDALSIVDLYPGRRLPSWIGWARASTGAGGGIQLPRWRVA